MGASFRTTTFDTTDTQEIKQRYDELVEECIEIYGIDSYNGTFSTTSGIKIINETFTNEECAEEYILERAEKWGDALAVTIKLSDKKPYTLVGAMVAE
jgi:hypothetical protein